MSTFHNGSHMLKADVSDVKPQHNIFHSQDYNLLVVGEENEWWKKNCLKSYLPVLFIGHHICMSFYRVSHLHVLFQIVTFACHFCRISHFHVLFKGKNRKHGTPKKRQGWPIQQWTWDMEDSLGVNVHWGRGTNKELRIFRQGCESGVLIRICYMMGHIDVCIWRDTWHMSGNKLCSAFFVSALFKFGMGIQCFKIHVYVAWAIYI